MEGFLVVYDKASRFGSNPTLLVAFTKHFQFLAGCIVIKAKKKMLD
jgi:hypothetical protein